jgi:site-specific DNA-methyltransferase (adenine-specific)
VRKEVIGQATLYLGDCLTILPELRADAVITDPPYGVGFKYESYEDTEGNWVAQILPRIEASLACAPHAAVCMSMRHFWRMPPPLWIVCWLKRGSVRHMKGGNFSEWEPVFLYGAANFPSDVIDLPDCVNHMKDEVDGHPCPKPVRLMERLLDGLGKARTAVVLDPFMGSGTTGVACMNLGRTFIGIEQEPKYFDLACRRLENAQRQEKLFA